VGVKEGDALHEQRPEHFHADGGQHLRRAVCGAK
jgi:hypothetical protein